MFGKKFQSAKFVYNFFVGRHWFLAVADVVLMLICLSYVKIDAEDYGLAVHLNLRLLLVGGLAWPLPYPDITSFEEDDRHG